MSVIDFIESDASRASRHPSRSWMVGGSVAALSALVGLSQKQRWVDFLEIGNLGPALALALGIVLVPWIYSNGRLSPRQKRWALAVDVASILVFSVIQPRTEISLAKFAASDRFWPENLHCLLLGALASFVASLVLAFAARRALPTPNAWWRAGFALVSGLCGLSALTFHCMGPLWSHIAISHWGQIALVFPVAYALQELVFRWQMRNALGRRDALKDLGRLG